jgi:hypothetical protein
VQIPPHHAPGSPAHLFGALHIFSRSDVKNVQSRQLLKRNGIPYEQGVAKTHSVTYATTSIQQSGQMIADVKIDTSGAWPWRLSEMMDHFQMPKPSDKRCLRNTA